MFASARQQFLQIRPGPRDEATSIGGAPVVIVSSADQLHDRLSLKPRHFDLLQYASSPVRVAPDEDDDKVGALDCGPGLGLPTAFRSSFQQRPIGDLKRLVRMKRLSDEQVL